ncbi:MULTISPECIES: NlpC/P60 family protein [unclassified Streptomyces]|uniref:C40 family peptidase n=1 Tax=unclassified Streptomyces TaxID=2593676 RepID=UPI003D73C5D2
MGTGTGRRGMLAVAVTVVCAVTVLAVPGTAFARSPEPTGPASPPAATSPSTPGATGAPSATPRTLAPDKDLQAVRAKLDALYHDAAVATDAYNAAEEAAEQQSAQIVALARKIVEGRDRLAELKERAGAAARSQYRTGGLPDEARLLLSDNPGQFLDGTGRVRQGHKATKDMLGELTQVQQDLEQYAKDATAQWQKLETNRKAKATAQKRVEQQIAAAKKLESELEQEEKERLARLEAEAARQAQTTWLGTGVLTGVRGKASAQGERAVKFATEQVGKPYVWGAEGPKSFDCSGLTSQAWASAGHGIPRTSQEQWRQLRHVDVKDMRPGDLIIYFKDASHVAMYVGDGAIIHAPRPGRNVTLAGAGSMPILGVVRPDA